MGTNWCVGTSRKPFVRWWRAKLFFDFEYVSSISGVVEHSDNRYSASWNPEWSDWPKIAGKKRMLSHTDYDQRAGWVDRNQWMNRNIVQKFWRSPRYGRLGNIEGLLKLFMLYAGPTVYYRRILQADGRFGNKDFLILDWKGKRRFDFPFFLLSSMFYESAL